MTETSLWNKILKKLDEMMEKDYDPETGLLQQKVNGINYHTAVSTGVVHHTRENLSWLPALLKRGLEEDREKAFSIIRKVLELQDKEEISETYGVWPYLFEESLDRMKNPDWNWAAFNGGTLIILLKEFRGLFPQELLEEMEDALVRACISIIRRNMGVDYTNISLMTAFVLTLSGEILENAEFCQKGRRILEQQLDFVEKNGGFAEYNSPVYGVLDIEETGKILKYSENEEIRKLAGALHNLCWKVFAEHYHYATGQLAPPHARCYQDLQDPGIRTLVTIGTGGDCPLAEEEEWSINLLWPFMTLRCPEELKKYFAPQKEPRIVEENFYKGIDTMEDDQVRVLIEKGTPALTSYTYLHPDYCLGTFRKHDMWNQRRPLMAYFATKAGTACFRVRCLHDEMDFSGAVLSAVQSKGSAAGGISFVTDHGDYHYILTPVPDDGITAENLSVDFVVTGALQEVQITCQKKDKGDNSQEVWRFEIGHSIINLNVLGAAFGAEKIHTEEIDSENAKGVRIVLYSGGKKKIDLKKLEKAFVTFWMEISADGSGSACGYTREEEDNQVVVLDTGEGFLMEAKIPQKPGIYMKPVPGMAKEFKYGGFIYHPV